MYLTSFMVSIHQRFLRQLKRALFGPPLSRDLARICFPVDDHSLSVTEIDSENAIDVLAYEDGWLNGLYLPSPYTTVALCRTQTDYRFINQQLAKVPESATKART